MKGDGPGEGISSLKASTAGEAMDCPHNSLVMG